MKTHIHEEYEKIVKAAKEIKKKPKPVTEVTKCKKSWILQHHPALRDTQSYVELYSMLFGFFPITRTEIPEAHNKHYKGEIRPCLKGAFAHIHAFINEKFNLMARLLASGLTFGPMHFRFNMSDIYHMGMINTFHTGDFIFHNCPFTVEHDCCLHSTIAQSSHDRK